MTYQPAPSVTIGGVNYTDETINAVTITRGRDTVYAEPQPGFATVRLIDKTGDGIPLRVGEQVTIKLEATETVFRGTITDWTAQLYDAGIRNTPASIITVTAVGPLMRLNRRIIYAAGRTAELDADRITDILITALAVPWQEASGTWADQEGTWANYLAQPFDPALIDAGVFDLAAVPAKDDGYNAQQLAMQAAASGAGILYETGDGLIAFANADRRPANRAAGYYAIPADIIRADLDTSSQLADITNRVTVTYSGGATTSEDIDSIQRFGVYSAQIDTELANLANAEDRADDFIARHAVPTVQMGFITIRLDGLPDATVTDLLNLDINSSVRVPVPDTMGPTSRRGFIEQIQTRFDPFRAELVLKVSDFRLSEGSERWGQVNATLDWDSVSATLTWQNASEVTS